MTKVTSLVRFSVISLALLLLASCSVIGHVADGMLHVFVNGEQVLRDGKHTGATPGKFVKGPDWAGKQHCNY